MRKRSISQAIKTEAAKISYSQQLQLLQVVKAYRKMMQQEHKFSPRLILFVNRDEILNDWVALDPETVYPSTDDIKFPDQIGLYHLDKLSDNKYRLQLLLLGTKEYNVAYQKLTDKIAGGK